MKKELLNEILKIKVLSNYDTSKTSVENEGVLVERTTLKTLAKDARYLEALRLELDDILRKTGALGSKGMLKTSDDVIFALKNGSIEVADLGRINHAILKTSKNPALRKTAAGWIVSQKTFGKAFSSGTATQRLAKLKELNPNMSDEMIRDLHMANELRLKNLGKSGKLKPKVEPKPKVADDAGKLADDAGKVADDAGKVGTQNVSQNVEVIIQQTGRELDDVARQKGWKNIDDWARNDKDDYLRYMDGERRQLRNKKGIFSRFVNWGRRSILFSTLLKIAKWGAIGYGVWWLYNKMKEVDIDTVCEEGEVFMGEGIGCKPKKPEDDKCPEGEHFEQGKGCVKDGGGGGGGGGGQIKDPNGNTYIECTPPYYKGCVGKKGDDNIRKVQDCLGVTPNGFFNKETEDALFNKINKRSFSPSDMPTICAKSSGTSGFQI